MVECYWIKASESTRHLFLKEHFVLALFISPYLTIISPVEWRSIRSVGRAIGWCHKIFIFAVEASFYKKKTMRKIAYMRSDRRDSYFNVVESEVVGTDIDDVELSLFLNIAKRLGFNVGYL